MLRCSFVPGQPFYWGEAEWEVLFSEGQTVTIRESKYGKTKDIALVELFKDWENGHLRFPLPKGLAVAGSGPKTEPRVSDLSQLPKSVKENIELREQVVQALLNKADDVKQGEVLASLAATGIKVPSLRTALRWMSAYLNGGLDSRSLAPKKVVRQDSDRALLPRYDPRLRQVTLEIFDRLIRKREQYTIVQIEKLIRNEAEAINLSLKHHPEDQICIPLQDALKRQLYRLYDAMDLHTKAEAAKGKKAADGDCAEVRKTVRPEKIMEQAIIDNHKFDLLVVDPETGEVFGERPWLTYCLDACSGYPLGYYLGFENPSTQSTMDCLFHAITRKDYVKETFPRVQHTWEAWGVPEQLYSDNGREFKNRSLQDAARQLDIELLLSPPGKPWYRGAIERAFRTLIGKIVAGTPGRTFSNPQSRGDYDSKSAATITPQALVEMVHIGLLDIFAEEFHEGVKGIPARIWADAVFPPSVPPLVEDLVVLLSQIETRTIQRSGIHFMTLRYSSPELANLRTLLGDKAEVTFKFNPSNLGNIWVWHPKHEKWLVVPAVDGTYAQGVTLYQHKVHLRLVNQERKSANVSNLAAAQKAIEDVKEASATEVRKIRRKVRYNKSRYATGGKDFRHLAGRPSDSSTAPPKNSRKSASSADMPSVPDDFADFDPGKVMGKWRVRSNVN